MAVQTRKGIEKRCVVAEEEWTTFHRSAMLAVLAGLDILTRPCDVELHTPDPFLVNMIRGGNMEKWKREEWRRPQDKELKNKDLWQQLAEHMEKHQVHFVYTEQSAYSEELRTKMEEYQKGA